MVSSQEICCCFYGRMEVVFQGVCHSQKKVANRFQKKNLLCDFVFGRCLNETE